MTDEVRMLLMKYQEIDRREKDDQLRIIQERSALIKENDELREKVNNLQSQLEKSMKLCEEWSETNRKWQSLCERMMGQR